MALCLAGCGVSSNADPLPPKSNASSPGATLDSLNKQSSASPATSASHKESTTAKPYRLLGVLDPDREKMVAFAMKVPSDWRATQEFDRKWEGAVGLPQIGITLRSPDGNSQIVYFPSSQYIYSEGPMSSNLRAQKRSFGLPEKTSQNELAPMSPVAYLKEVFLPMMEREGLTVGDRANEQTAPETRNDKGQTQSRGSIDGTLPNGNRARIEVRLSHSSRQLGTDLYHSWTALPSITQTSTPDLERIHQHTVVAQDSIVVNPTWLKMEQEAQGRGMQANMDASRRQHEATMTQLRANTEAMTRGHEQRMQAIRQFGEANTARFNQRMADMDRDQRIRVDTIRGESKYVNPDTGERGKIEDGFNHVYQSQERPDFFLGTDVPIQAGSLNWQELQQVQLKDY